MGGDPDFHINRDLKFESSASAKVGSIRLSCQLAYMSDRKIKSDKAKNCEWSIKTWS